MRRKSLLLLAGLALSLGVIAEETASEGVEAEARVSGPQAVERAASPRATEQLELDAIAITGFDELPRILHIVPWKAAEPGEVPGRPVDSLLNEVIAPIDRREYRRQLSYHAALHDASSESD